MNDDPENRLYRGFAYVFGSWYDAWPDPPFNGHRSGYVPDSSIDMSNVRLCCHHIDGEGDDYGSTADGHLQLWKSDFGVAAAFTLRSDRRGTGILAAGINSRKSNGLSLTFEPISHHRTLERGEMIVVIDKARAIELSICDDGRCWDVRCWPRDALESDSVPTGIRRLAEHWEQGLANQANVTHAQHYNAAGLKTGRLHSAPAPQQGRRGLALPRRPPHAPGAKWRPPQQLLDDIDAILRDAEAMRAGKEAFFTHAAMLWGRR
jgi:hypothetical protein